MKKIVIKEFSQIGNYHYQKKEENQDYYLMNEDENYIVVTLADGVSTQKNGLLGAKTACKTTSEYVLRRASDFMLYDKEEVSKYILKEVLYELEKLSQAQNEEIESYSSTLLTLIYDKNNQEGILMNLGDGVVLGSKKQKYFYVSKGRNIQGSTFVTTSNDAYRNMEICKFKSEECDRLLLGTDGIKEYLKNIKSKKDIDYEAVKKKVTQQLPYDDCSFIEIKFVNVAKRKKSL